MLSSLSTACDPAADKEPQAELNTRTTTAALLVGGSAEALVVAEVDEGAAEHCSQAELNAIADLHERFEESFECGDELFEVTFNEIDGVGAKVGEGKRFTRVPRADLAGNGEWLQHQPARATGPNAQSCNSCHNVPADDGAGAVTANAIRDPLRGGNVNEFIDRNTPHVFASGALQRLAEEMTDELMASRSEARTAACAAPGNPVQLDLSAKGVDYGTVTIACDPDNDDLSTAVGIDSDLIVKPYQWKGSVATLRDFNRGAGHNELGMQAVEIAGEDVDGDSDGVVNELLVGDITALTIYLAAQPRPVTKVELAQVGEIELSAAEQTAIQNGAEIFNAVGCADCHTPTLVIDDPIFSEPSQNPFFRDATFPAGQDPVAEGVSPDNAITFDLTADQPDNIFDVNGTTTHLGAFPANQEGGAIVGLYSDLKRHDLGPGLAENIDEDGISGSVWMTKELWGVGSTAPYLHDGRATTLMSAILEHGGEAEGSKDAVMTLSVAAREDLVAFLANLVLFKAEVAAGEEPSPEPGITAVFKVNDDWGSGYCGEIVVTNSPVAATTSWQVVLDLNGTTRNGGWNGTFSGTTGTINVSNGFSWNAVIPAGQSNNSVGFCATRRRGSAVPSVVSATGSF